MVNSAHQEGNGVRLERYSPLAPMGAATEHISLDALAFMTTIPARYMHLLGRLPQVQNAHLHDLKMREREREFADNLADLVRLSQHQIDSNMLTLKVGGKDIQISQGELRRIMEKRVEALKERRDQLAHSGGDPKEIARLDNLIERYEPVIETTGEGMAKTGTMDEIDGLLEDDPEFKEQVERDHHPKAPVVSDRRTSFSASEFDQGGIVALPLSAAFARSATPDKAPQPAPVGAPEFEQRRQNLDNTFQSLGLLCESPASGDDPASAVLIHHDDCKISCLEVNEDVREGGFHGVIKLCIRGQYYLPGEHPVFSVLLPVVADLVGVVSGRAIFQFRKRRLRLRPVKGRKVEVFTGRRTAQVLPDQKRAADNLVVNDGYRPFTCLLVRRQHQGRTGCEKLTRFTVLREDTLQALGNALMPAALDRLRELGDGLVIYGFNASGTATDDQERCGNCIQGCETTCHPSLGFVVPLSW